MAAAATVGFLNGALAFSQVKCEPIFSRNEFKNVEVWKRVEAYKLRRSEEIVLAKRVAEFGADAVPFAYKLGCRRHFNLFFMDPKAGFFGSFVDNRFMPYAHAIIAQISDPAAIPNLVRIAAAPVIGGPAQDAIIRLQGGESPLPKEVLKTIIEGDARNWLVGYYLGRYERLMQAYSPEDKTEIWLFLLDPGKFSSLVSFDTALNIHGMDSRTMDAWKTIVRRLGQTGTEKAVAVLRSHESSLSHALWGYEERVKDAKFMSRLEENGRKNVATDIDRTKEILAVYREAITAVGK